MVRVRLFYSFGRQGIISNTNTVGKKIELAVVLCGALWCRMRPARDIVLGSYDGYLVALLWTAGSHPHHTGTTEGWLKSWRGT